jgi:hypothetical protein
MFPISLSSSIWHWNFCLTPCSLKLHGDLLRIKFCSYKFNFKMRGIQRVCNEFYEKYFRQKNTLEKIRKHKTCHWFFSTFNFRIIVKLQINWTNKLMNYVSILEKLCHSFGSIINELFIEKFFTSFLYAAFPKTFQKLFP